MKKLNEPCLSLSCAARYQSVPAPGIGSCPAPPPCPPKWIWGWCLGRPRRAMPTGLLVQPRPVRAAPAWESLRTTGFTLIILTLLPPASAVPPTAIWVRVKYERWIEKDFCFVFFNSCLYWCWRNLKFKMMPSVVRRLSQDDWIVYISRFWLCVTDFSAWRLKTIAFFNWFLFWICHITMLTKTEDNVMRKDNLQIKYGLYTKIIEFNIVCTN